MTAVILFLTAIVLIGCSTASAADYMTEKPDYLQSCERKMPNFRECLVQVFEPILTKWQDGVPGLKNIDGSMDPVFLKEYEVIDNDSKTSPLAVKMLNVTYSGLRNTKLKSVDIGDKNYNFKFHYLSPKTRFEGQYSAIGKIMLFQLDSNGSMILDIMNTDFTVSFKTKLKQRDNIKFFDVQALKLKIEGVENVHVQLDNLFADKDLTENTNIVFNENWREFYSVLQPISEKSLGGGFFIHFKRIFDGIPAKFFIADVEKAEL